MSAESRGADDSGEISYDALLRTILSCDLVASTDFVHRLGDQTAASFIRQHDSIVRSGFRKHGGREIDKTDGFLALFERPIQAVGFALQYINELRALAKATDQILESRVGIHIGEVIVWRNAPGDVAEGAKPVEVEGLAKMVAARIMGLAGPGQILLSGAAKTLAQRAESELSNRPGNLVWRLHGEYQLKGVPEAVAVFEVGEPGVAPLTTLTDSSKAWRRRSRALRWLTIASATCLLLTVVGSSFYRYHSREPALELAKSDWVVIGEVANVSADKALALTFSTAFRVGMEQSRFVNVVSEAQSREVLARMQRDTGTPIERQLGSELAQRAHARALIMPSLAQYGDNFRLTAELIDPDDSRTVSVATEDAGDINGILAAIDRLTFDMRRQLGESLKEIRESQPLAKVTTSDIRSLRAYSEALSSARHGEVDQAHSLLASAIELDPGFAAAYGLMGSLLLTEQRYDEARAAFNAAISIKGRLTDQDTLFIRAQLARFEDPQAMARLWTTYATFYPDRGTGQNNLGNVRYALLLDYQGAEKAYREAADTHTTLRNFTLQTLGHVLLARGLLQQAEEQFQSALTISPAAMFFGLSDVLAASGRIEEARHYLDNAPRQAPVFETERSMRRATLAAATGDAANAAAIIATTLPQAAQLPSVNARWRALVAMIALSTVQGQFATARDLATNHMAELQRAAMQTTAPSLETMEHLLYSATWAARLGLADQAREAVTFARRRGKLDHFPVRAQLATLVDAELNLASGHAETAIEELQSSNENSELWEWHEIRARAERAIGDHSAELTDLNWLVSHGGLAYGEWIDQFVGQQVRAFNLQDAKSELARRRK